MPTELKVLSFNLRTEAEVDGINHFRNRHGRVIDTITSYEPDLIGFQEVNDNMRAWLTDALAEIGYTVVGCGRNADFTGESMSIAYRRDRIMLISLENRWLSGTPDLPGSRFGGDQSRCPRMFTSAVLRHRDVARPFVFLNTHLDHKGTTARLLGAVEVMQYLSGTGLPFIVTGDMNARPDTPEIRAFTEYAPNGTPVTDATVFIGGTYHGFKDKTEEEMSKIDYIFTDCTCEPERSFALPDDHPDGLYISDHRPVCAFVQIDQDR